MKQYFTCTILLLLFITVKAAQPATVIKTVNTIRKAISASKSVYTVSKVAIPLGKCANAIPEKEIARLAQIATKPNGLNPLHETNAIFSLISLAITYLNY